MRRFRLKVTENGATSGDISEVKQMKQLNVWPLAILLICIVFLIIWLGGLGR
jgi:hypothetical protein